ncbi:hypothetical protein BKA67DRAFT_595738 [Truncatella angustata]|uniref:Glutamate carboxypeptidase n=1 Tax=Truncatella angustata TaxID=152316 RepID=A0A9P8RG23_9PEZI|nr:uncharacterized protein BKA67DRAFT_595738 [Truncatella angustata]KAH6645353.1 hypothetical protein BKA67DRAFT_595738 [Truncatella angustata]
MKLDAFPQSISPRLKRSAAHSNFDLRQILLSVPSHEHVRNWSAYYTSDTHLAGQGLKQAQWTQAKWKEFGVINTTISSHDTQLPLPINGQRLALLENDRVLYEAPLVDANASVGFVPAYFGFSANGNISGSYVFCNFGSPQDFIDLAQRNISLAGKIAIIKLGTATPYVREKNLSMFRALSVHNAQAAGMIGVVLYTDPGNDGPTTEGNGYKPFPDGPARPLEAIERGGLGSIDDFNGGQLPSIPCIPMSAADAIQLLSKLNGHGPSAKEFGNLWELGGLGYYGVDYNVGPSPPGLSLHVTNHADILDTQIHNVIGTITGRTTDEVVIVGNHRDAWGPGAGDPGSGSAALNEVVRSFGEALKQGWRPERTIIFASFEGEEFLQVGSLLWVTKHLDWLRASAVAYLNVVVAASGSHFHAKASPLLYSTVLSVTDLVLSPNQTAAGQSVRDVWGGNITPAGSGDANRFMSIPCVSTLDFGFTPALGEPVFPYHTGFDSFEWMDEVGDPGWKYHVTSAKMWALMTAHLVEPGVLNMNVTDYALAFQGWLEDFKDRDLLSPKVDLTVMFDAVERLSRAASRFDSFAGSLRESKCTRWKFWARCRRTRTISGVNRVYKVFERQFYYGPGINGHADWHHVVFTPSAWHNTPLPLPGLSKSLQKRDWENAQKWRDIIVERIGNAAYLLEAHLEYVDTQQGPGVISWIRQTFRPYY